MFISMSPNIDKRHMNHLIEDMVTWRSRLRGGKFGTPAGRSVVVAVDEDEDDDDDDDGDAEVFVGRLFFFFKCG